MNGADQGLWWVSLVDPALSAAPEDQVPGTGGFLGVVITEAAGAQAAVDRASEIAGESTGTVRHAHASVIGPFPVRSLPAEWCGRLLTQDEADRVPEPVGWPSMPTPPVADLVTGDGS